MYNEELKQKFIDTQVDSMKNMVKSIFIASEKLENEKDKDIAEFTIDEIFDMFNQIGSKTYRSLYLKKTYLANYVDFYQENRHIDIENNYRNITVNDLIEFTKINLPNRKCLLRSDILSIIDRLPNAIDQFFILALYEGIRGDKYIDLLSLKMSDIDKETLTANLASGKKIKISKELYECARMAAAQVEYIPIKNVFEPPKRAIRLENVPEILRVRNNTATSSKDKTASDLQKKADRVSKKMYQIKTYLDCKDLSISRIFLSGFATKLMSIQTYYGLTYMELEDKEEVKELIDRYGFSKERYSHILGRIREYL